MKPRKSNHNRTGRARVAVLMVLCGLVFALFLARLAWMQFLNADVYAAKAEAMSTTTYQVALAAARGAITDRNGVVLAQNATAYDLDLIVPGPEGTDLQQTCKIIEAITGGEDVETQLAAFCSAVSAGELRVAQDLTAGQLTELAEAGLLQSGAVRLSVRDVRSWPDGTLLPHALGYTGPVTADQWQALKDSGVAMDAEVGQAGLEAAFDELLRGVDGVLTVKARRDGTRTETVTRAPQDGATLVLTVDAALQRRLQDALQAQIETLRATKASGKGRETQAGAAVVVDVETGGILAAASWPGYDLNTWREDYADLAADSAVPLLDRVSQGLYAPGSAFKPAVAAAALAQGFSPTATVWCSGRYTYYAGYQPRCLQLNHGGAIDLMTALQHSCNIYFYDVGRRLGVDIYSTMARELGLAQDTGAEIPQAEGLLTWSGDENYQSGLVLQAAIGQGNTAVTPLQLARYAAALANGGVRPTLHFAEKAVDGDGNILWRAGTARTVIPGGEEVFGPVQEGMERMAQGLRVLRESPIPCAAKTGSPQLPATLPDGTHLVNSVLIGYAPADDPQIAIAVVLEKGGGGSNAAAVFRSVLDYCAGR